MDAPCRDCKDRHVGCHARCERYIAFNEEQKELRKKKRSGFEYTGYLGSLTLQRHKRRRNKNGYPM